MNPPLPPTNGRPTAESERERRIPRRQDQQHRVIRIVASRQRGFDRMVNGLCSFVPYWYLYLSHNTTRKVTRTTRLPKKKCWLPKHLFRQNFPVLNHQTAGQPRRINNQHISASCHLLQLAATPIVGPLLFVVRKQGVWNEGRGYRPLLALGSMLKPRQADEGK